MFLKHTLKVFFNYTRKNLCHKANQTVKLKLFDPFFSQGMFHNNVEPCVINYCEITQQGCTVRRKHVHNPGANCVTNDLEPANSCLGL